MNKAREMSKRAVDSAIRADSKETGKFRGQEDVKKSIFKFAVNSAFKKSL